MSMDAFIPEIWASEIETGYHENLVVSNLSTASVSGEVRPGNAVNITTAGDVTIVDYAAAGRRIEAEDLSVTGQKLLIDNEKAFAVRVDDIDKAQAAGSMEPLTADASRQLAADTEKNVLTVIAAGGDNLNTADAPVTTPDEALAAVAALRTQLSKNEVPHGNRVLFVNPEAAGLLISKVAPANFGAGEELRNGIIGRLLGFDVYETAYLVNTTEANEPAFIGADRGAWAFASSITETEAVRAHDGFADVVRGLAVYGAKVIKPTGIVRYLGGEVVEVVEDDETP